MTFLDSAPDNRERLSNGSRSTAPSAPPPSDDLDDQIPF
jgi:hypothetical protein